MESLVQAIQPFKCDQFAFDKATIRKEWEKWLRAFEIYAESEEIEDPKLKRSKLLYLGGPQLQEVAYGIPGAIVTYVPADKNDVYKPLLDKLTSYFSPQQNTTFERYVFRSTKTEEGESFDKFLLRIRQQAARCDFGNTKAEATNINIKDKIIDTWATKELKKKLMEKERSLDDVIALCQVKQY